MTIDIDLNLLNVEDLSPDDFVLIKLIAINKIDELAMIKLQPDINSLIDKELITVDLENFRELTDIKLTTKAFSLLQIVIDNEFYEELAKTFVELWENTKPGTISSDESIISRLKLFIREYSFDIDTIKAAAAYYVDQQRKNGNFRFMKTIANFIMQKDDMGGMQSTLYAFCVAIEKGDDSDGTILA